MVEIFQGITRGQIMLRAWQLARLNRKTMTASLRIDFGRWLSHAWKEAREARTDNWSFLSPEHEIRSLEHQFVTLEQDDRRTDGMRKLMASLRASINELRAA